MTRHKQTNLTLNKARWHFPAPAPEVRGGVTIISYSVTANFPIWIMEEAEKLEWPSNVDAGDGIFIEGGTENAWYHWLIENNRGERTHDSRLSRLLSILHQVQRAKESGDRDPGHPGEWGDFHDLLQKEEAERNRLWEIESARLRVEDTASLLNKIEGLGWPRIHVKRMHGRGVWLAGEAEWRAAFEVEEYYQLKSAVDAYEYFKEERSSTANLKPDTEEGLTFAKKVLEDMLTYSTSMRESNFFPAFWVVSCFAMHLGLKQKGSTPSGRIKKFIEMAVTKGLLEPCSGAGRRGDTEAGYRLTGGTE